MSLNYNQHIEERLARLYIPVRVAAAFLDKDLRERYGSCRTVTVFGSYEEGGRSVIEEVSRFISDEEFCAVTLEFTIEPGKSAHLRPINQLIPHWFVLSSE